MQHAAIRTALTFSTVSSLVGGLAVAQLTERPSVATGGAQANAYSVNASTSLDGRYVAFQSFASNLTAIDTNGTADIFLRDRATGTTTLISANFANPQQAANGPSQNPMVSADGAFVAFFSDATDLVSPSAGGGSAWVRDVAAGVNVPVSRHGNGTVAGSGKQVSISANGRYIAFDSFANDIVAGDLNNTVDVFVFDRVAGTTVLASKTSANVQANNGCTDASISPDGRYVSFTSTATNLDPLATSGIAQIYLKDLASGALTLVSQSSLGVAGDIGSSDSHVSSGGHCVSFSSFASNLVAVGPFLPGIYLRDVQAATTERCSVDDLGVPANNSSYESSISADGRFVAFQSAASNLDVGATASAYQVFLRDRVNSTTRTVSLNSAGQFATPSGALNPALSGDGRFVVFESDSTNLVANDTNAATDVFLRDRMGSAPFEYGVAQVNSQGCTPQIGSSGSPSHSAGSGFLITCTKVLNKKPGLLFYSTHGSSVALFQGGFLYCKLPTVRTHAQNSAGSASGTDCTGHFSIDFNTWIASGADPALLAGTQVWSQYWSRDPAVPSLTNLSDALTFVIAP